MTVVCAQRVYYSPLYRDFYLRWEWQFSRPRAQCGRMSGICVCGWMLQIRVAYTSITEQRTHTHRFASVRTPNMHAYTHRIVSVIINDRRVWIAHWCSRKTQDKFATASMAKKLLHSWIGAHTQVHMHFFAKSRHAFTGVVAHHACAGVYTRQMLWTSAYTFDKDDRWPEYNSLRRGDLDYCPWR